MKEKIGVVTMIGLFDGDNIEPPLKEMFFNPQSYKFVPFDNVWGNKTPVNFFKSYRDGKEENTQEK